MALGRRLFVRGLAMGGVSVGVSVGVGVLLLLLLLLPLLLFLSRSTPIHPCTPERQYNKGTWRV